MLQWYREGKFPVEKIAAFYPVSTIPMTEYCFHGLNNFAGCGFRKGVGGHAFWNFNQTNLDLVIEIAIGL